MSASGMRLVVWQRRMDLAVDGTKRARVGKEVGFFEVIVEESELLVGGWAGGRRVSSTQSLTVALLEE